ncbi:Antigen peptide transporter 2, partial [Podila humilis]
MADHTSTPTPTPTTTNNNDLKEEIIELEKTSSPPDSSPPSHFIDIDSPIAEVTSSEKKQKVTDGTGKKIDKKKKKKNKKKKESTGENSNGDVGDDDDEEEEEEEEPTKKVSYLQLYRFASTWDWICVVLGSICAILNGIGQPLIAVLMGDIVNSLARHYDDPKAAVAEIRVLVIKFTVVGAIAFVAAYGQMCFWTLSAENQSKRIRE